MYLLYIWFQIPAKPLKTWCEISMILPSKLNLFPCLVMHFAPQISEIVVVFDSVNQKHSNCAGNFWCWMHRKKGRTSREKKHKRLSREYVFATDYAREVLQEEGDVSLSPRKASCFLVTGGVLLASEREQRPRFSFGDLILYLPVLWAPLSFPYYFAWLPSSLLFSSFFFPNPFLFQREEEQTFYLYASLHFVVIFFALALANVGLKKSFKFFHVLSASHVNSWKIWKLHCLPLWICGNTLLTLFSCGS